MTNARTKKEEGEAAKKAAEERNAAADEADVAARAASLNYNSPAEFDPNSQAHAQRPSAADMAAFEKRMKWYHDASHSADATRLAAQRARDEEAGMVPPVEKAD